MDGCDDLGREDEELGEKRGKLREQADEKRGGRIEM